MTMVPLYDNHLPITDRRIILPDRRSDYGHFHLYSTYFRFVSCIVPARSDLLH